MTEAAWLTGITINPQIMPQTRPYLEREDIQACLVYARRLVGHE